MPNLRSERPAGHAACAPVVYGTRDPGMRRSHAAARHRPPSVRLVAPTLPNRSLILSRALDIARRASSPQGAPHRLAHPLPARVRRHGNREGKRILVAVRVPHRPGVFRRLLPARRGSGHQPRRGVKGEPLRRVRRQAVGQRGVAARRFRQRQRRDLRVLSTQFWSGTAAGPKSGCRSGVAPPPPPPPPLPPPPPPPPPPPLCSRRIPRQRRRNWRSSRTPCCLHRWWTAASTLCRGSSAATEAAGRRLRGEAPLWVPGRSAPDLSGSGRRIAVPGTAAGRAG